GNAAIARGLAGPPGEPHPSRGGGGLARRLCRTNPRTGGSGRLAGQAALHGAAVLVLPRAAGARGGAGSGGPIGRGGKSLSRGPPAESGERLVAVRSARVPARAGPDRGGAGRRKALPRRVEVCRRGAHRIVVLSSGAFWSTAMHAPLWIEYP